VYEWQTWLTAPIPVYKLPHKMCIGPNIPTRPHIYNPTELVYSAHTLTRPHIYNTDKLVDEGHIHPACPKWVCMVALAP